jgi:hypothetical protein
MPGGSGGGAKTFPCCSGPDLPRAPEPPPSSNVSASPPMAATTAMATIA